MNFYRRYAIPLNLLVIAVTIVFVGAALVVGRAVAAPAVEIAVGLPSPEDYIATRTTNIVDVAATDDAQQDARDNTAVEYSINRTVLGGVRSRIALFFEDLGSLATLTAQEADIEQERSDLQQAIDAITDLAGGEVTVLESTEGEGSIVLIGTVGDETTRTAVIDAIVAIDARSIDAVALVVGEIEAIESTTSTSTTSEPPPEGEETTSTTTTTTTIPEVTTTTLPRREAEEWVEMLQADYPDLDAIPAFVELYSRDLDRIANGEASLFADVVKAADTLAVDILSDGLKQAELDDVRDQLRSGARSAFIPVLSVEERELAHPAIGELVADELLPNEFLDETLTSTAKEDAAAEVEDIEETFLAGAIIATQGEVLSPVQYEAIIDLDLVEREPGTSRKAIVVLGGLTVLLAAFFLWRLSPGQWSEPKHFALLGILLVLAALTSRMPELVNTTDGEASQVAFAIPAMLFGYVAAILYDPRTAILMAVPVTTFVGISTGDPAITVFAATATVTPVAFVSSVSSRRQLRVAVALAAFVLVPFGAAVSWLFRGQDTAIEAALFSLLGGILAGLVAQGLVSFLENLFRITTTLTLLDLVDRNHPALRLIEEKAPGTFNHSILVGTLAGKAAREIGAEPLLAQAAAFYHDLGKTEDPMYFIENQFSITNPHDHLDPVESCKIIRSHVTDGQRLARQYRLPSEISAGIRCHHGTGLMRYFYHQALEADPDADPQLFRHHGEKPKGKEMAILMISDAVEGAARAHAQQQDPTQESITKVVDAVVGEKLDDGQLDEADLTFGDLTKVKTAIVEALVGYYHTRVPYPGFPGPRAESSA